MLIISVIVFGCVVALVSVLTVARGRARAVRQIEDVSSAVRPVDLAAFRNLMNPQEEEYLQALLPPRAFRRVQRMRMAAAADYVRGAASNAAVLIRLGEAARSSPDPEIAEAAGKLVNDALRLRMLALLALVRITTARLVPGVGLSRVAVGEQYEQLVGQFAVLGRLQGFPKTSRTLASL